jgi:hypothetical protein
LRSVLTIVVGERLEGNVHLADELRERRELGLGRGLLRAGGAREQDQGQGGGNEQTMH